MFGVLTLCLLSSAVVSIKGQECVDSQSGCPWWTSYCTGTDPTSRWVQGQCYKSCNPAACITSYCDLSKDHTMCVYPGPNMDVCKQIFTQGLSDAEKAEVVDVHNQLRQNVAAGNVAGLPAAKAGSMKTMSYNEELATIAQRWADQCRWNHLKGKLDGHDNDRGTYQDIAFNYVGQNMYIGWSSADSPTANWTAATMSWYNEVSDFLAGSFNSELKYGQAPWSFGGVVGHFTQVVWGESYQIGCGFTFYYDETKPQMPYTKLYICNYGPGGNVMQQPMYEQA